MNRQDLDTRLAYNRWANRRLLEAARRVSPEAYDRDVKASFGSLRGTLLHILWAESWWLRAWRGEAPPPDLSEELPDVPALAARWTELEREQEAFVASLSDDDLEAERSVRGYVYRLGELVHHLLNHSTYHRGQVALLLRQLGEKPPATDFRLFLTELRYGETY